jgi:hypothetical protein
MRYEDRACFEAAKAGTLIFSNTGDINNIITINFFHLPLVERWGSSMAVMPGTTAGAEN